MKISKDAIIGIVVIISIGILIWGVNFLKGMDIFTKERSYYAKYTRVDGLKNSSPVTLKGYKVGLIKRIAFSDRSANYLIVEFSVQQNFQFPKNSVARIISSDIMGTKEIKIIPGDSKEMLQPGDTISGSIEGDLKEQVSMQMLPLKTKAERLMSSVDSVLAVIQYIFNENARENLSKSFTSIRQTIQNLESTSGTLDTLMTNQKGKLSSIFTNVDSITYNLKNNNQNISNILNNFSTISDSLAKAKIGTTLIQANSALSMADSILIKINAGEGSMGALVNNDTLYQNLESASQHLSELLADLKENPKKYVRFSLFDAGRTVYKGTERTRKQEDKAKGVFYQVQIHSSSTPIPLTDKIFKSHKNIQELSFGGKYQYTIGNTQSYREIIRVLKKAKKDFPEAFIIKLSPEN
ncbi:MAG: MlaD family protein [Marinifilaceae bacterium]